ncbi:MAG: ComEC/Rec2 family competence protein [Candidatus Coatesbacteria bacterium]
MPSPAPAPFEIALLRRAPLGWGVLAGLLGILAADAAGLAGAVGSGGATVCGLAAVCLAAGAVLTARRGREGAAWALALGAAAAVGGARLAADRGPLAREDIGRLSLPVKHAIVEALVTDAPRLYADRGTTVLVLEVHALAARGAPPAPAQGTVRATLHWMESRVRYGDLVRIEGTLLAPPAPSNPGQRDARRAMARQGVRALLSAWEPGRFEVRARDRGSRVLAALLMLRRAATARLAILVGPPESDLLGSIVFGLQAGFDPEVLEAFRATGLMHILVASGLNVGILAWLCLAAFRAARVPRARASLLALPVLVAYLLLCGADPPLLRSTLMFGLLVAAGALGRPTSPFNALGLAAGVILLASPEAAWDTSFQFSFVSTAGVMALVPTLVAARGRIPAWLVEAGACTLAAQLALLPFLASTFGTVPCLGAVANLLVTPTMGIFLSGGLALLGLGWVPLLGPALGWFLKNTLAVTLGIVEAFAGVPLASVVTPPFPGLAVAAYLAWTLGGLLWLAAGRAAADAAVGSSPEGDLPRRETEEPAPMVPPTRTWPRAVSLAGLAVLALLVWRAALRPAPGDLTVTVLDVGQGAAAVIRLPSGRAILVDAGPPFAGLSVVSPYLAHEAVGRLSAVILTHPHDDHAGGMETVLRRHRADVWLASGCGFAEAGNALAGTRRVLRSRGIPVRLARAGLRLEGEPGVAIEVLHPPEGWMRRVAKAKRTDENAVVLAVRLGDTGALLAADIEGRGEALLAPRLRRGRPFGLLVLGHHGSDRASSRAFLAAVRPRDAVAAAGAGNRFGFPNPAVVIRVRDRGARLWVTGRDGAIRARADGRDWSVGPLSPLVRPRLGAFEFRRTPKL